MLQKYSFYCWQNIWTAGIKTMFSSVSVRVFVKAGKKLNISSEIKFQLFLSVNFSFWKTLLSFKLLQEVKNCQHKNRNFKTILKTIFLYLTLSILDVFYEQSFVLTCWLEFVGCFEGMAIFPKIINFYGILLRPFF